MVEDVAWTTMWIQSIEIMLTVIAKAMMDLSTDFTSKKWVSLTSNFFN